PFPCVAPWATFYSLLRPPRLYLRSVCANSQLRTELLQALHGTSFNLEAATRCTTGLQVIVGFVLEFLTVHEAIDILFEFRGPRWRLNAQILWSGMREEVAQAWASARTSHSDESDGSPQKSSSRFLPETTEDERGMDYLHEGCLCTLRMVHCSRKTCHNPHATTKPAVPPVKPHEFSAYRGPCSCRVLRSAIGQENQYMPSPGRKRARIVIPIVAKRQGLVLACRL
ncbi:uncharacterized protein B0I36DRAFT_400241, partial [Microdochium trichocladiopsis]